MTSTSDREKIVPLLAPTPAENGVFAALETAFGDTLWPILSAYLHEGEVASKNLQQASTCAHWQEAVRQAKIIASKAHDLDFRGVTDTIRTFASVAYDTKATSHQRRNAAQMVVLEFERSQILIESRYPGLVETQGASVA